MEVNIYRSINDSVWVMYKDKSFNSTIVGVRYHRFISPVDCETICEGTSYEIATESGKSESFEPDKIFSTKEELIASL